MPNLTQKNIEAEKKWRQTWKSIVWILNNAVFDKTIKILRNGIDVSLISNTKIILNGQENQAECHKKYLTMI